MDSRFWGRGSDSEDDSEDEASDSEEEEESDASDSDSDSSDNEDGPGRFLADGSDSDSEEEDKRVVRSAKDKRFEELSKSCDEMRNKMKVNDWSSIQTVFEKLQKQLEKAMKTANLATPPRVYIAILCELEDCLNSTLANKEVKKKMSPTNAKALNTMKQRLRKYLPEFDTKMAEWRENPVLDDEEEEESEEESEEEEEGDPGADEDGIKRREKKRDELLTMDPEKITYEMVGDKARYIAQARGKRGTDRQEQLEMLQFLSRVAKGPVQSIEVLMQYISTLFDLSINLNTSIPVHVWQRAARAMFQVFRLLEANHHIVLDETLEVVVERTEEPPSDAEFRILGNVRAFIERLDDELFKILQLTDSHTTEYIARLREEPILLALADKAVNYFQRIKDARNVAFVALRQAEHFYYKSESVYAAMRNLVEGSKASGVEPADVKATPSEMPVPGNENKSAYANGISVNGANAGGDAIEPEEKFTDPIKLTIPQDFHLPECCHKLMKELVQVIYVNGDERSKARAVLTHIYHKCIHDDFHSARDALLMSHLQDQVHTMDVPTMIMYNRAMTQLGLCAFRSGLIQESHACLAELYGSNRIRELLAQGMSLNRYQEKTPEQEKLERRRQMPFHMHVNLEMVEAVYLTCAALLEIPNIAAKPIASTRYVISKPFLRLLETYRNQVFTGPPESVRDHIMAAARALSRGDWEKAFKFITALKMWTLMPNRDAVTDMLKAKLKKEGLRTYLFAYSSQYKALSLQLLSKMFQLGEKEVSGIVSAMMMHNELPGSWDQPTSAIVMRNLEESRLQKLASQVSERALQLLELNERALAFRTGSLRDDGDHDGDGGGHKGRRRRDGGGGDWDDHGFMRKGGRGRGRGGGRGRGRDRDDGGHRGGGGGGDYGDRRRGGRHSDNMHGGGHRRRDGGFGGGRRDRLVGSGNFMTLGGGGGGNRNDRVF